LRSEYAPLPYSFYLYQMRTFLIGFGLFSLFGLSARYYAERNIWQAPAEAFSPNGANSSNITRDNTLTLYYQDSLLLGGYETLAVDALDMPDLTTNNRVFLEHTLAFLQQNKDKILHITGSFQKNEMNDDFHETKGILRAAALRDYLVHAGLSIERISLNDVVTEQKPAFQFNIQDKIEPILRFDAAEMTFFDDNFMENSDDFRPKDAFLNYMEETQKHLNAHPHSYLDLTIYMDGNDANKTEQFAISRAQSVKNYIVALGLLVHKVKINIKINDVLVVKNNSYDARLKNHRFVLKVVD
jgi:outer membrane protein OmpA-like peptidoglycan-associated protein